ncbi:MAG: ankyrin repeat domain-containing protein [Armatimonadota bacterium]|nr:ankyrin repeat domain-containing protein [Armatimonadota bacterium]
MSKPTPPPNPHKDIIKAAKAGDCARIRDLIAEDASLLQVRDTDDSTLLHYAVWRGHPELVNLLLDMGADVNATSNNTHWGNTPLHAAAHGNQRAIAEVLLDHGADIHAEFGPGRTPLQETGVHKATAVAKLLKERGATR